MATITEKLISEASVTINAPAEKVWKAITTPSEIKKYLMGTNVESEWKEGSPIAYKGEYNGKAYHDKGIIKKFEPNKVFQSTYWSSAGGKEDKPENYNLVTYTLSNQNGKTLVTLSQDNVSSEKEKEHLDQNWTMVMNKLKEVVEKGE
ncbi:MAG: SRPBCC family protein [Flavitalea sp.]